MMGGRGSFSGGNPGFKQTFRKDGNIAGAPVLVGINGHHGLPEEAGTSRTYIQLWGDGTFKAMRFYLDHLTVLEIAYQAEPPLNHGNRKERFLHAHDYPIPGDFTTRPSRRLTDAKFQKYRKYFKGVPKNAKR